MPTVLLTFANSEKGSHGYLENLSIESTEVDNILTPYQALGAFKVIREERATKEVIINKISHFQNDIIVFLYSGHAGSDKVFLEDGEANALGLSGLLGDCPNLKLVILNGCSTKGQVKNLLDNRVPIVIATDRPIDDKKATLFCITFFTAMSVHNKTIREAFETAIQAAQLDSTINFDVLSRGIGRIDKSDEPNWGLYCNAENESLLTTWRLPAKKVEITESNKWINKALEKICEDYIDKDATDKADKALEKLPYIISELLRSLKSGKTPDDVSNNIFYNTPSFARFERLLYTYRSMINLLVFVKLADLWNQKTLKPELVFDDTFAKVINAALLNDSGNGSNYNLLMQLLDYYYEKSKLDCYVSESKELFNNLKNNKPLIESIEFLEAKINNTEGVKRDSANIEKIAEVCSETERHLARVLFNFGFFAKYELLSIKDIELKKLRHQKIAQYFPRVAKLRLKIADKSEEDYKQDESAQMIDSSSVILYKNNSWKDANFLNLSPFLIDKNALSDPKSTKAEVYYLASVAANNELYDFRQVARPSNYWNVRPCKKKKDDDDDFDDFLDDEEDNPKENDCYPILKSQFDVLKTTLFGNMPKSA